MRRLLPESLDIQSGNAQRLIGEADTHAGGEHRKNNNKKSHSFKRFFLNVEI